NVSHAQCTKSIVDYIVDNSLNDIVLLGHSFGGTIISKVAETVPERIRRLIFFNAFALQDSNSLNDEVPKSYVDLFNQIAQTCTDSTVVLAAPAGIAPFGSEFGLISIMLLWSCCFSAIVRSSAVMRYRTSASKGGNPGLRLCWQYVHV